MGGRAPSGPPQSAPCQAEQRQGGEEQGQGGEPAGKAGASQSPSRTDTSSRLSRPLLGETPQHEGSNIISPTVGDVLTRSNSTRLGQSVLPDPHGSILTTRAAENRSLGPSLDPMGGVDFFSEKSSEGDLTARTETRGPQKIEGKFLARAAIALTTLPEGLVRVRNLMFRFPQSLV